MNDTFNLIDKPWILTEQVSGASKTMSLREVFSSAQKVRYIDGEIPTQTFAILGLLGAILQRALIYANNPQKIASSKNIGLRNQTWNIDNWLKAWNNPEAALQSVADYLTSHHDRFDLKDPTRPFYQVADLHTKNNDYSGLEKIIADVPNGQPFFTSRLKEGNEKISWAEAARWLIHAQAFDPSGIRSGAVGDPRVVAGKGMPNGAGWSAQIGGYLIEQETLWQTLMINLVPSDIGGLQFDAGTDLPVWEREQLTEKEEVAGGRTPTGPVDLATWQSRRIRLIGDTEVYGVVLCQGDPIKPQYRQMLEPRSAWRYSDPQTKKFKSGTIYMPREHDPQRSVWQGLEALLPDASPKEERVKDSNIPKFLPPALSGWLAELIDEDVLASKEVCYRAIGVALGSNNSVITEIIDDSIVLPAFLFAPKMDEARNVAVSAAQVAEDLSRKFGSYAGNLTLAAGGDNADGESARAKEQLLAAISPHFAHWVKCLTTDSLELNTKEWRYQLYEISEKEAFTLAEAVPPIAFKERKTSRGNLSVGKAQIFFRTERRKLGIVPRGTTMTNSEPEKGDSNE